MMKNADKKNEILDLNYFVNLVLKNWLFIGLCVVLALAGAYFINKYSTKIYEVKTSILISENSKGLGDPSAQLMRDIGFIHTSNSFANEMIVLQSAPIIHSAIKKLNFDVSYFEHSPLQQKELYKSSPFLVIYNREHPQLVGCRINIEIKSDNTYRLWIEEKNVTVYSFISNQSISYIDELIHERNNISFGSTVTNENYEFRLLTEKNFNINNLKSRTFSFVIRPTRSLVKAYQRRLNVKPPDLESTVAEISIQTVVPSKDIDFLNSLTETYLNKDIEQKKLTYKRTVEYIDNQLNEVQKSLQVAEDDLQNFRSSEQIVNISYQAEQIYNELNELKNEKAKLRVNLKYVDYILEYFEENELYSDLITPSAMGIDDPTLNNLVDELIKLNAEKASFIENNQEKSPYLNKINVRIDNLRNLIIENIKYIKKTTTIALNDMDSRIRQLNNEIRKMPETERQLTGIERIFNINDAIYTYLLQKKSEAEIAEASYQPDAEIVESASLSRPKPVSPKENMNYIIALFLGFIFPVSLLRVYDFFESSIRDVKDFSKISDLPVLGAIYHNNKNTEDVINNFPNSHITESFRKLRINMKYFLTGISGNIVVVSSSISAEGKSFVAYNLANILANYGERTILVGFDLRKPRKYQIENLNENVGISKYLSNQANIEDIIQPTPKDNLDVILASSVPPNPSELVASEKTDELLNLLKQSYDYIIIDTAPIGPVTDAFILMEKAKLVIFTTRLKRTPRHVFQELSHELETRKIKSAMVINDLPIKGKSRYGYGYYQQ